MRSTIIAAVAAFCCTLLSHSILTFSQTRPAPSATSRSAIAAGKHDCGKWEKEIAAFEQLDRTNPPPKGALLFIGSSTIRLWKTLAQDFPEHRVINRGFGGSEIVDAAHFAERIIFPYEPRMIFLRAGGNDIHAGRVQRNVPRAKPR